jgi:type VI secretion system protein ImpF
MAPRGRGDGPITLSILDRLIDDDPKRSEELPLTRSQSLRELKVSVCRDLEWLFNSRQALDAPDTPKQVRTSLYSYGLPDITSFSVSNVKERKRLSQVLEEAVRLFEPRILNPKVILITTEEGKLQRVRFVIEGLLRVDPAPEPVSFDTSLNMANGEYEVGADGVAR